jgi:hypothetical protein
VGKAQRPRFSFFCELKGDEFRALCSDTTLLKDLRTMGAFVRVGLIDLSEARAEGVLQLNRAGIPVVAWLLLSEEEGYWFHAKNGDKAHARYDEFQVWTTRYGLHWEGVGIDIEPSMEDIKLGFAHPWRLAGTVWKRLYDKNMVPQGQETYNALIRRMRDDGYPVESYIIPMILDERASGTTTFQQALGILDLKTDKEIPMCYSSDGLMNHAKVLTYTKETRVVALGSTGGGIILPTGKPLPTLNWEELSRDILLARQNANEIHIFSLEGAVQQGFIPKLRDFNFQQDVYLSSKTLHENEVQRDRARRLFILLSYPTWLAIGLVLALVLSGFLVFKIVQLLLRGLRRLFRRS